MDATHIIAILGTVLGGSWAIIVKLTLAIQTLNEKLTAAEVARVLVAQECGNAKEALWRDRLAAEGKLREAARVEIKEMWVTSQTALVQTNKALDGILDLSRREQPDATGNGRS